MKNVAHNDLIEILTREALSRFHVPQGARVQCFLVHHDKLVLLPQSSPLRKHYKLYEYPSRKVFHALRGTKYDLRIDTSGSELYLTVLPQATSQTHSLRYKVTKGHLTFERPKTLWVCGSPLRK
jgi:hypothetical protein